MAVGLIIVVLLAYQHICTADAEFCVMDDGEYVLNNPHVQGGLSPSGIAWAFYSTDAAYYWHPTTWLSLQLDHDLYGLKPWGFRLTNVILHIANSLILFLFLERTTRRLWPSAMVAGLFALHPLHVESVAWITERKDVLSTFFALLSIAAYAGYVRRSSRWLYVLSLVLYAAGLMAKPMIVTLPFALLLLDVWPLARVRLPGAAENQAVVPWPRLLLEKVPYLVLAIAVSIVTLFAQMAFEAPLLERLSLPMRVLNACHAAGSYVVMTFWPVNLAPMYSRPLDSFPWLQAGLAVVFLLAVTLVVVRRLPQQPYLAVGWFWFLGTLVPVSGLVQVGAQTMADRFTYVPHIGLFVALVWWLADILGTKVQPRGVALGAGLVLLACFVLTWRQAELWRDNLTLMTHATRVMPNNFAAHQSLALAYLAKDRFDEAIEQCRRCVAIEPRHAAAHFLLGQILQEKQAWAESAAAFREALRLAPNLKDAHHELGFTLMSAGDMEGAVEHLTTAVRLRPNLAQVQFNLALACLERGRYAESRDAAQQALRLNPKLAEARVYWVQAAILLKQLGEAEAQARLICPRPSPTNAAEAAGAFYLAWCLTAQGQADAARELYAAARRAAPNWVDRTRESAWRLATDPDPNRRNGSLAVLRAEVANQALEGKDAAALDTLAAAYAEVGRWEPAQATARLAKERATAASQNELAEQIGRRLSDYLAQRPARVAAKP